MSYRGEKKKSFYFFSTWLDLNRLSNFFVLVSTDLNNIQKNMLQVYATYCTLHASIKIVLFYFHKFHHTILYSTTILFKVKKSVDLKFTFLELL